MDLLKGITRKDMDTAQCQVPDCTHEKHGNLFIVQMCHRNKGLEVSYDRVAGHLIMKCHACKNMVALVAVASGNPEPIVNEQYLLLDIAGFLKLMVNGITVVPAQAKKEANELLNKISDVIGGGIIE